MGREVPSVVVDVCQNACTVICAARSLYPEEEDCRNCVDVPGDGSIFCWNHRNLSNYCVVKGCRRKIRNPNAAYIRHRRKIAGTNRRVQYYRPVPQRGRGRAPSHGVCLKWRSCDYHRPWEKRWRRYRKPGDTRVGICRRQYMRKRKLDTIEAELDCRRLTLELMEHDRDPVVARIMQRDHPERGPDEGDEQEREDELEREDLLDFLKGGRKNRNTSGYSDTVRRQLDTVTKKKLQKIFAKKTTG